MLTVYQKKLVRAAINRRMEQAKNDEIKRLANGFGVSEEKLRKEFEVGTIHIKNLSSLTDKLACHYAAEYWTGEYSLKDLEKLMKITIKKKGHTFIVLDVEKEKDR